MTEKRHLSVRVPETLLRQVQGYADAQGYGSTSEAVVHLLRAGLRAEQTPAATRADLDQMREALVAGFSSVRKAVAEQPVAAMLPASAEELERARAEERERIRRLTPLQRLLGRV